MRRAAGRGLRYFFGAVLALAATLGATRAAAQQGPRITGVVFDSTSMQPLPGARVGLLGTQIALFLQQQVDLGDADLFVVDARRHVRRISRRFAAASAGF